jgi:hypothetical protein
LAPSVEIDVDLMSMKFSVYAGRAVPQAIQTRAPFVELGVAEIHRVK